MKKLTLIFGLILNTSFLFSQLTYVPDNNFEQALIDLGYDDVLDDYVLTANIDNVEELTIRNCSISDLTGIEDFIALETLDFANNQITDFDLSNNKDLTFLNFAGNQCTSIDLNQNASLVYLVCPFNHLISLDISNCVDLIFLNCWNNQLTNVNVSNNTALEMILLEENKLTSLDITANTSLIELWCHTNQLTSLNIRNGNNSILGILEAYSNPDLACIEVDSVEAAYGNSNWNKDETAIYSEDCNSVGISDSFIMNLKVITFPNPFTTSTTFSYTLLKTYTAVIKIFNSQGQQVEEIVQEQPNGPHEVRWNAEGLPAGMYYFRIQAGEQIGTGKLVFMR